MLILKDYELPRRVETFGKGISDSKLKERLDKIVETDVSLEQCARFCSLGSGCNMFHYRESGMCDFYPHLGRKSKSYRGLEWFDPWTRMV